MEEPTLLSIVDETISITESQFKDYPLRFLSPDPNKGLNEFSFQLILYTNLIRNIPTKFTVIMEKIIEGRSRCDLFIKNNTTNEILIIELKYIRISYLNASRIRFVNDEFKYQKILEDIYSKIKDDNNEKLLKLLKWSEHIVSTKDNKITKDIKYETINDILVKAEIQAKTYSKQYQNNLDWRTKQPKIYYMVIIGLGFRIIRGVLNLYQK